MKFTMHLTLCEILYQKESTGNKFFGDFSSSESRVAIPTKLDKLSLHRSLRNVVPKPNNPSSCFLLKPCWKNPRWYRCRTFHRYRSLKLLKNILHICGKGCHGVLSCIVCHFDVIFFGLAALGQFSHLPPIILVRMNRCTWRRRHRWLRSSNNDMESCKTELVG